MGFEPQVEKVIAGYRRRTLARKVAVLIPIILVAVICCMLFIGTILLQTNVQKIADTANKFTQTTDEPVDVSRSTRYFAILIPLLIWVSIAASILCIYYFTILKPVMRQYKFRSGSTRPYSKHRYHLFNNALEGAAIAAGIKTPGLAVVNLPTANALTFEIGGIQTVGVTVEMLEADLSYHEIEAVMAHQTAHISMQSGLKAPLALKPKTIALVAFPVFLLALLAAVILKNVLIIMLPLFAVPFIPLWMTLVVKPYLPWRRLTYCEAVNRKAPLFFLKQENLPESTSATGPGYHESLTADSLAVKITSNPGALKSAILKLKTLMESAPVMPDQTIAFPHLFIGPLKEWDAPIPGPIVYHLNTVLIPHGKPIPTAELVETEMRSFILIQQNLFSERIENLEAIKDGEWRQFQEVSGGRVRPSAKAWRR